MGEENVFRLREQQERARRMLRGGVREMWGLEGEQSEERGRLCRQGGLGKEIGHLFLRDQEGSQDGKRNVGNRNVDMKGSQGASRACV